MKYINHIFQVTLVLAVLIGLVYVFTYDSRLERRIDQLEEAKPVAIETEKPILTEPDNPHQEYIDRHEEEAGTPLSNIAKLLIRDEGISPHPYTDSKGIATIGYGRSLETNGVSSAELHAIVRNVDYRFLIENSEIRSGRIYIKTLSVAEQVFKDKLTQHDMELLLVDDLKTSTKDAISVFGDAKWQEISEPRREVIIDLVYNLGLPHFKSFTDFIDSVKKGDWSKASTDLLQSQYARTHTIRSHRLSAVAATGDPKYFQLGGNP